MAHVARQANAAGHTAEADGDLEQLGLLCYNLTCLHTAHPKPKSANKIHIYMYIYILIIDYVYWRRSDMDSKPFCHKKGICEQTNHQEEKGTFSAGPAGVGKIYRKSDQHFFVNRRYTSRSDHLKKKPMALQDW